MSRWSQFFSTREDYPQTNFEAYVFLSHARLHIMNGPRGNFDAHISARYLLDDAMATINTCAVREVA